MTAANSAHPLGKAVIGCRVTRFLPRAVLLSVPKLPALDRLRRWLQDSQALTYPELTQRTGLGERQLARLVQQLRVEGLPIVETRQGRLKVFTLPPEQQQVAVPDLRFDNAELRALVVATKASQAVLAATPHAAALHQAFGKLLDHARPVAYLFDVDEPRHEWYFEDSRTADLDLTCFRQLEEALDARQSVRIDYFTAGQQRHSRHRRINPYVFAWRSRSWMLVAYCHERRGLRTFALARISRVEPCPEEYFEIPAGFDPERYFAASLGAITAGETYTLRLLVEPNRASYFRERPYHPTQIIEETQPDGRLVVSYELEGLDEMRSFCQSWGTGITVQEPAELRERLRQEAEALALRYR